MASGTYLCFVDSDDFLEPNVYGYMLRILKEQDADAVQFSFRDVYKDHAEEQILSPCVLNEKEYLVRFTKDWSCPLLWNKLYKRSLYDGIFFEEGHKIDDEYFTYQGFLNPQRWFYLRSVENCSSGSTTMVSPARQEKAL